MKKTLSYFLYTMLIACIVCACSDRLDIVRDYGYSVETLPLPKKLAQGENGKSGVFDCPRGVLQGNGVQIPILSKRRRGNIDLQR